jgi:hypothetical protein
MIGVCESVDVAVLIVLVFEIEIFLLALLTDGGWPPS